MIDPTKMTSMFTGTQVVPPVQPQAPQVQPVAQPDDQQQVATQVAQDDVPQVTDSQVPPTQPPQAAQSDALDNLAALDAIVQNVAQEGQPPVQQAQAQQEQPLEGLAPQAVMQAVVAADTLNPPNPAPATAKETFEKPIAPDAVVDANAAVLHVETEPNPEIPVEVESFLQRAEQNTDKLPQEVVIADGTSEQAATNYPSRPVIVLPITEEEEKAGKSKGTRFSIRWLVEWSHKIIKMFAGKVIYRHDEEPK